MNDKQNSTGEYESKSAAHGGRAKPVLRDTAYRSFMDYLLSGQLKPGLLVSQRELCETTGSTIGAMREALKRLEAEGVITLIPQRGVMVREPSEREINDVYEVRKIVETHAIRAYAESGDLDKIAEVKQQTLDTMGRKPETRQEIAQVSRERSLIDDRLHQIIINSMNNQTLDELFERLRLPVQVSRLSVQPRFIDSLPGLNEHLLIIDALEKRDGEAAAAILMDHLEKGRRRAVGLD
ncbi:MAG: GntR family transcriptional regulator [Rhodospirillales bacterium]|nr:GntR family transcriptional regulator [Rhodospirillales bacterium]